MPTDIKLDPNSHDLDVSNQTLELYEDNVNVVAQRVKIALLLRAGEWFADVSKGVPYIQFSRTKQNKAYADTTIRQAITQVEGVTSIREYSSVLNGRLLEVSFTVETTSGEIIDLILEV